MFERGRKKGVKSSPDGKAWVLTESSAMPTRSSSPAGATAKAVTSMSPDTSAQAALCCWNGGQGIPNSAWYCGGMEPGGMSALCCQPTAPIGCAMYKNCCPLEAPVCCPTTVQGGC